MIIALVTSAKAQISGDIVDTNGFPIAYASAMYKGHHIAVSSDMNGHFTIDRHEGWALTFSSMGFKAQTIKVDAKTPSTMKIVLKEDTKNLSEVLV